MYTVQALQSKWNLAGECPRQNNVLNATAKKVTVTTPACIRTSIKWTEILCSLVASHEFDTLGGGDSVQYMRDCNTLGTHIMKDLLHLAQL